MARPVKVGLNYFPIDIDFFSDEKIEFISAKFGLMGEAVVLRLLTKIYRNGYYLEWNDDVALLFRKKVGIDFDIKPVIEELIKRGFFDKKLFDEFGILTSRGIQRRYAKACEDCKRKNWSIDTRWDLIGINQELITITPDLTEIPPEFSTQIKVKEIKEDEKVKENVEQIKKLNKSENKVKGTPASREETKENFNPHKSATYTLFLEECFSLFYLTFHEPPSSREKNQLSKAITDYSHMLSEDEQFELVKSVCRKVNENTRLRSDDRRRYFFGTLKLLQQEACGNKSRGEALEFKQLTKALADQPSIWNIDAWRTGET